MTGFNQFSTDDPLADRLQIETEEGPEDELWEEEDEELSEEDCVYAVCGVCGYTTWRTYPVGSTADKEQTEEELQDEHKNCHGQLEFK